MRKYVLLFCLPLLMMNSCASTKNEIALFCREEGSGTREMFVRGLGIMEDGIDSISDKANVTNSGAVMLSAVEGNENAIGFISAATVGDGVKVVSIDGHLPLDREKYPLFRDYIVAFNKSKLSKPAVDFLKFLQSDKAAEVAKEMGYYEIDNALEYESVSMEGKVVVAGSASVFPLMDRLREEYAELQPDVEVEIQQNDSSTGIALLAQGMADIAMSSRNIKPGELGDEYDYTTIAGDAIAVIVHPKNSLSDFSSKQLRDIFAGKVLFWDKIGE